MDPLSDLSLATIQDIRAFLQDHSIRIDRLFVPIIGGAEIQTPMYQYPVSHNGAKFCVSSAPDEWPEVRLSVNFYELSRNKFVYSHCSSLGKIDIRDGYEEILEKFRWWAQRSRLSAKQIMPDEA